MSASSGPAWQVWAASSTSARTPRRSSSSAPSPPAGLQVEISDAGLHILAEGSFRRFLGAVEQVSFSGQYATENRKTVLFITERAVFTLGAEGLTLQEIAPGVDLEKDILAHMDFIPAIRQPLKLMDARIFKAAPMGLQLNSKS